MRARRELKRGEKITRGMGEQKRRKEIQDKQTAKGDDIINTGGLKVYTLG